MELDGHEHHWHVIDGERQCCICWSEEEAATLSTDVQDEVVTTWFRWRDGSGWWTKWHVQHPGWTTHAGTLCGRHPVRRDTAEDHKGTPEPVKACWSCRNSLRARLANGDL